MNAIDKITAQWQEDGSARILARVTADDATGAATGVDGEGNWIKQADLSSVTCKVFNRTPGYATPDTAIATPTFTISTSILDTPVTTNVLWTVDQVGYNLSFLVAGSNFPDGNQKYVVELFFTTTGSSTWWLQVEGVSAPRHGG